MESPPNMEKNEVIRMIEAKRGKKEKSNKSKQK
jgi:hypothetical protein